MCEAQERAVKDGNQVIQGGVCVMLCGWTGKTMAAASEKQIKHRIVQQRKFQAQHF